MTAKKYTAKLDLPKKVDSNTGKAIKSVAEGVSSLLKLPEKTLDMIENTGNTLFCVVSAYLRGQANIIEAKSFVEAQNIRKEISQATLAKNVIENIAEKEQKGEEIPEAIDDTDNLFSIQSAASETTDSDFLKFWSKLYTEEACKPNSISKRTIDLCRLLDKHVASILENEVFPYCSEIGFIANIPPEANNLLLLKDYGLVDVVASNIIIDPVIFEPGYPPLCRDAFGDYWLWIHPGYSYRLPYRLTEAGKEIRRALGIYPKKRNLKKIGDTLSKEAQKWDRLKGFIFHKEVKAEDLFVITDNLYPPFLYYPHPQYRKFERYWEAVRDTVTENNKHHQSKTTYSHS